MLQGKEPIAQARSHTRQGQEPGAALPVRKAARGPVRLYGSAWSIRCDGQMYGDVRSLLDGRGTMTLEQAGQQPSSAPEEASKAV